MPHLLSGEEVAAFIVKGYHVATPTCQQRMQNNVVAKLHSFTNTRSLVSEAPLQLHLQLAGGSPEPVPHHMRCLRRLPRHHRVLVCRRHRLQRRPPPPWLLRRVEQRRDCRERDERQRSSSIGAISSLCCEAESPSCSSPTSPAYRTHPSPSQRQPAKSAWASAARVLPAPQSISVSSSSTRRCAGWSMRLARRSSSGPATSAPNATTALAQRKTAALSILLPLLFTHSLPLLSLLPLFSRPLPSSLAMQGGARVS